jgi:hypothetical protein
LACHDSGRLVAGLAPRSPGFIARLVCVGFLVDEVAGEWVFFSEYILFTLSVSFHQGSILIHSLITDTVSAVDIVVG